MVSRKLLFLTECKCLDVEECNLTSINSLNDKVAIRGKGKKPFIQNHCSHFKKARYTLRYYQCLTLARLV